MKKDEELKIKEDEKNQNDVKRKQGRIHGNPRRGRLGRGNIELGRGSMLGRGSNNFGRSSKGRSLTKSIHVTDQLTDRHSYL